MQEWDDNGEGGWGSQAVWAASCRDQLAGLSSPFLVASHSH